MNKLHVGTPAVSIFAPIYVAPMSQRPPEPDPGKSLFCSVLEEEGIALVRVVGRGSFSNSLAFKNFTSYLGRKHPGIRIVIDFQNCEAVDSTFMGVLVGVVLAARHGNRPALTILNVNESCLKSLKQLGVLPLLEVCRIDEEELEKAGEMLEPTPEAQASQRDQILLTLKAHRQLVEIDKENAPRFQGVIEYLEKSLEEEDGQ